MKRQVRDTGATGAQQGGAADATPARHGSDCDATAARHPGDIEAIPARISSRRLLPGGPGEGIGHAAGVDDERSLPIAIEGRAGEPLAQPVRARTRHARCQRGARDAAAFKQGRKEDTLLGRRPVRAVRRRRIGWLLFHRQVWSR